MILHITIGIVVALTVGVVGGVILDHAFGVARRVRADLAALESRIMAAIGTAKSTL